MKKKILIVEDNTDSLDILTLLVGRMGYHAIEGRNSREAVACVEAESPDLIFMDMGLPEVDGIKTSAMLKRNAQTAHISIIAITAWMSELWRERPRR